MAPSRRYDYAAIKRLLAETDLPCWRIAQQIGCSTSLVHLFSSGRIGREPSETSTKTNDEGEHAR